eukprot:Tamp_04296.p1 GENE.Tamp_04296~~Tamp_04296.p1  ORF type:complete len:331 (+),score=53.07 Tamp_04296:1111-2103(+)
MLNSCVFLLGCYLCTQALPGRDRPMTPEQVWECFQHFDSSAFMGYRDATFVRSTWDLSILDSWRGLMKGLNTGLIDLNTFKPEEYEYYDHPKNGDMHVMVPGKFIAFKGPSAKRYRLQGNITTHTPKDYVDVFKHHKVSAIVRLNDREYNRKDFIDAGFNHYDLFFEDCTTPDERIVKTFMDLADKEKGSMAVHCLAGLGRTGTLIGLWIMKHYQFTAEEVIAYLRILRPGSIIGPQQQYLCEAARQMAQGNFLDGKGNVPRVYKEVNMDQRDDLPNSGVRSVVLAQEVKEGMLRRHSQWTQWTPTPHWPESKDKDEKLKGGKQQNGIRR